MQRFKCNTRFCISLPHHCDLIGDASVLNPDCPAWSCLTSLSPACSELNSTEVLETSRQVVDKGLPEV